MNSLWLKEKPLNYMIKYWGHFFVEADAEWIQAEVGAELERQRAIINMDMPPVTKVSPAFVLNQDFKPEPESEYHVVTDDEDELPQRTANYWDEWRAREGFVERHLTPVQYGAELRKGLADKKPKKNKNGLRRKQFL